MVIDDSFEWWLVDTSKTLQIDVFINIGFPINTLLKVDKDNCYELMDHNPKLELRSGVKLRSDHQTLVDTFELQGIVA